MFAKGPMPGWSPKTEALKLCPAAVCTKHYAAGIVGFLVRDCPDGAPLSSAGTSREAWEKALTRLEQRK